MGHSHGTCINESRVQTYAHKCVHTYPHPIARGAHTHTHKHAQKRTHTHTPTYMGARPCCVRQNRFFWIFPTIWP